MNYSRLNKAAPLQFLSPLHKAIRQVGDHLGKRSVRTGLSTTEAHLLSYLRSYGPCAIGTVVEVFGLKKSTLTGVTDRLVARGLLTRSLNPDDRRSFLLELTAAGRERADHVRAFLEDFEQRIADQLSDADLTGFRNVMTAIARATAPDARGEDQP